YDPQHATPAETMQVLEAIRGRICDSVRYTLAPGKTPPKRDFVAYFLLENHKGYCQHYATAGTILARMAGIPARYCEGYFVSPEDLKEKDGVYSADVLDSSAHAWSEVYIEGFGWIPFEFTYSYFDQPEPIEEPTTEPPAPETTATAATTTTAATSSAPSATTTTTTAVTPDKEPHVSVHLGVLIAVLVVLLVILAVIGLFVLLRRTALANRNRLFTQKDTDAAAHAVWRYLIELVRRSGANVRAATEGSLTAEMLRTCTAHLDEETIRSVLQIGAKLRYSPHGITREELGLLKSASGKLAGSLYENANPVRKFYYKWICHYV
ncbi:MAG: transglutaminase domain-containing protein, partial [Oscillospiraceae bacterium]|nr:transglutaminase domain-containing protein [Oscillospiraceae bacterium]